jgi:hypothetical protein
MANLIGRVQGFRKSGSRRNQEATRLGDGSVLARVATWRTFAQIYMRADGSGYVMVTREPNHGRIHSSEWGPEGAQHGHL